ncbi:hypothetical protein CC2G_013140 [Coprinopsis cinerea AmutBmut pab1-1]|nr:hypothetical protein CC2G_013140 [Coprinopsis cinerea AmutBmut pab1-1]
MPLRLTTLLSRNPKLIEQHVRQLADYYAGNNLLCLFTLSASDSVDWTSCWRQLRRIAGEGKIENVVGCLSSPLNNVGSKEDGKNLSELLSCSIGIFEPGEAVAFRSQIPGDRQPQVGRWHSFRKHPEEAPWNESMSFEENISWENVWKQGQDDGAIPLDLQGARPEDISAFLYLTDRSYQGLARSLTRHYPNASKVRPAPCTLCCHGIERFYSWVWWRLRRLL